MRFLSPRCDVSWKHVDLSAVWIRRSHESLNPLVRHRRAPSPSALSWRSSRSVSNPRAQPRAVVCLSIGESCALGFVDPAISVSSTRFRNVRGAGERVAAGVKYFVLCCLRGICCKHQWWALDAQSVCTYAMVGGKCPSLRDSPGLKTRDGRGSCEQKDEFVMAHHIRNGVMSGLHLPIFSEMFLHIHAVYVLLVQMKLERRRFSDSTALVLPQSVRTSERMTKPNQGFTSITRRNGKRR